MRGTVAGWSWLVACANPRSAARRRGSGPLAATRDRYSGSLAGRSSSALPRVRDLYAHRARAWSLPLVPRRLAHASLVSFPDRAASRQHRSRRHWRGSLLRASFVASAAMSSTIAKRAFSRITCSPSGFSWSRATAKCVASPRTSSYSDSISVIERRQLASPHSHRNELWTPPAAAPARASAVDSFCSRQRACFADSCARQLTTAVDLCGSGQ